MKSMIFHKGEQSMIIPSWVASWGRGRETWFAAGEGYRQGRTGDGTDGTAGNGLLGNEVYP